ncbi:precorrin-8X methylmutase [Swingsia samuiensis]|uniref:Precorrin-8X methylmutase n=1 Tax=Swingsia samuiensis TaxID=1293412 RepID=A0A4Y6UMZ0_9PROT|nr:precorrin-8X methylmutase [Swingsia samuiensis]QDH17751.1 precorrin-8X methylmutase [Swingsia samuiensis]
MNNNFKEYDYIRDGAAIYTRSFATIRSEADLTAFTPAEAKVVVRIIHACGMVDVVQFVQMTSDFVMSAKSALQAGKPILCDSEMVAHGITRARLPSDNEVICTLRDPRTPQIAQEIGNTRSAAALQLWGQKVDGAVVVIGNAPTALYHLLELIEQKGYRPAAIIGMPVGFVGAAESKDELATRKDLPHVIVRGRLGGSAMASATVNALASELE